MKKFFSTCFAAVMASAMFSQTVSTFENLSVPSDSFISPKDIPAGFFESGNVRFPCAWDTTYGYWSKGFAPSSKTDKTTAGSGNLYSASTGGGYNSPTYAIGKGGAGLKLIGNAAGKPVNGFYVTNTTYANLSMQNGDQFAKKFGGTSGNDPDFFLLTVKGFNNGVPKPDSVNFYLADFRFNDNAQDYILDTWAWIDLKSIGDVDSLVFRLTSSDEGQFGMNTPSFFAFDNLTTSNGVSSIFTLAEMNVKTYPNPVAIGNALNIELPQNENVEVMLTDISGRIVHREKISDTNAFSVPTHSFSRGTYLLSVRTSQGMGVNKITIE